MVTERKRRAAGRKPPPGEVRVNESALAPCEGYGAKSYVYSTAVRCRACRGADRARRGKS